MTNDTITMTQSSHPITWPWKALENTHLKMVIPDHLDDKLSNHLVDSNSLYITWFHVYIYTRPLHLSNVQTSLEPSIQPQPHPHTCIRDFDACFSPRLSSLPLAFPQSSIHPRSFSFHHKDHYESDEIRITVEWPTWTCRSRLAQDIPHFFFRNVSLQYPMRQHHGRNNFFLQQVSKLRTRSIRPSSRHKRRPRSPPHRLRHPLSSRIRNLLLHRHWRTRTVRSPPSFLASFSSF